MRVSGNLDSNRVICDMKRRGTSNYWFRFATLRCDDPVVSAGVQGTEIICSCVARSMSVVA